MLGEKRLPSSQKKAGKAGSGEAGKLGIGKRGKQGLGKRENWESEHIFLSEDKLAQQYRVFPKISMAEKKHGTNDSAYFSEKSYGFGGEGRKMFEKKCPPAGTGAKK